MQTHQLPKIYLKFRKIFYQKPVSLINVSTIDFAKLIPNKVSKQVTRINRAQIKENANDIILRDGNAITKNCLLNLNNNSRTKNTSSELDSTTSASHSLRKLRIESTIQAELVNFFSSVAIPKILRNDFALWIIENVI